jgi:hypothetical protein
MGTVAKKGDGKEEGEVVGVLPQGKPGTSDGLWWTVFGGLLLATFWTRLHKVTQIHIHSSFLFSIGTFNLILLFLSSRYHFYFFLHSIILIVSCKALF